MPSISCVPMQFIVFCVLRAAYEPSPAVRSRTCGGYKGGACAEHTAVKVHRQVEVGSQV